MAHVTSVSPLGSELLSSLYRLTCLLPRTGAVPLWLQRRARKYRPAWQSLSLPPECGGDRVEASGQLLQGGAVEALDQGQKPEVAGNAPGGRQLVTPRLFLIAPLLKHLLTLISANIPIASIYAASKGRIGLTASMT
jgi:hypothetical protein